MTTKEKELLLKDLCARLPYGVKALYGKLDVEIQKVEFEGDIFYYYDVTHYGYVSIDLIKPYLRPMSSMTEEEKYQYKKTQWEYQAEYCAPEYFDGLESYDWLNKKMFAYRTIEGKDMFELGLALKAPEGMYEDLNNERRQK